MTALLTVWYLLAYLSVVELAQARVEIIDIFNGGKDDIRHPHGVRRLIEDGKMHSAIFNTSQSKWNLKVNGKIVIPYTISGKYDDMQLKKIKKAMKRIRRNTCIRFRKKRSETDYLDIQNGKDEGCSTVVGRQPGRNVLSLEANENFTCVIDKIVQHELLHVIGLHHEHNRYDRDNYIKILYNNILPGEGSQFDIIPSTRSTTYNIPYDYTSLMHYGKKMYARPGMITMETLNPKYADVIGTRTRALPKDYQKVCNIYGCKECNTKRKRPGYLDANPYICAQMKQMAMLDCSYDDIKKNCCASCKVASRKSSAPNLS